MRFNLKRAIYVALAATLFDSAVSTVIAFGSSPSAPLHVPVASPRDHDKRDRSGDNRDRGDTGQFL